jgi:hypothetical protein
MNPALNIIFAAMHRALQRATLLHAPACPSSPIVPAITLRLPVKDI